jgi:hypothetical protein
MPRRFSQVLYNSVFYKKYRIFALLFLSFLKYTCMSINVFDEVVDFITAAPQPAEIVNYRPSAAMQAHLEVLLYKKQNDLLTDDDRQELEQYMLIEHLMRMAKARAKQRMAA